MPYPEPPLIVKLFKWGMGTTREGGAPDKVGMERDIPKLRGVLEEVEESHDVDPLAWCTTEFECGEVLQILPG